MQDDGAKYLIKGAAPSLCWGPYTSGGTASSVSDVDFLVPRDGYVNPPVTGGGQTLPYNGWGTIWPPPFVGRRLSSVEHLGSWGSWGQQL